MVKRKAVRNKEAAVEKETIMEIVSLEEGDNFVISVVDHYSIDIIDIMPFTEDPFQNENQHEIMSGRSFSCNEGNTEKNVLSDIIVLIMLISKSGNCKQVKMCLMHTIKAVPSVQLKISSIQMPRCLK